MPMIFIKVYSVSFFSPQFHWCPIHSVFNTTWRCILKLEEAFEKLKTAFQKFLVAKFYEMPKTKVLPHFKKKSSERSLTEREREKKKSFSQLAKEARRKFLPKETSLE